MWTERWPATPGTSPTRITCTPPAPTAPVGASRDRAWAVALGNLAAPESSTGARIGEAIITAEASAACQSSVGAIVTAAGWVPEPMEGNTASATPAASATGSAPATRVVFLVASAGKTISCAAWGELELTPTVTLGARTTTVLPPQPASAAASTAPAQRGATRAARGASRRTARGARRRRRGRTARTLAVPSGPRGRRTRAASEQETAAICILPPRLIRGLPNPRSGGTKFPGRIPRWIRGRRRLFQRQPDS